MSKKKLDQRTAEKLMAEAEKNLGREAIDKVRKMDAKDINKMLKQLSDEDIAKLELAIKNPDGISKIMTPENTAKIKKILER